MTIMGDVLTAVGKGLTDRVPMTTPMAGSMLSMPLTPGAATPMGQQAQLQTMATSSWVFSIIDRIAQSVAAVEWQLFTKNRLGERIEIPEHPLLDLWLTANPFYTGEEFVETCVQHYLLAGEMWWLIVRNINGLPVELWPLRPDRIRPIPHPTEYITGYLYQPQGAQSIPLQRDQVIFIKRPNPMDQYRGLGVVQTLIMDIASDREAVTFNRNFFRNGAEPGGIVQMDKAGSMSDAQFEKFVERWRIQHQGVGNAHRVAVIEGGEWVDRKYTQRDMQFEQLRTMSRDVILGGFGMPPSAIGIVENVNKANALAGDRMFSERILMPILRRIRAAINSYLTPMFEEGIKINYADPTPPDPEAQTDQAATLFTSRIITRDEARERTGYDPAEVGGDEYASQSPGSEAVGDALQLTQGRRREADPDATDLYPDAVAAHEAAMDRAWARRLAAEATAIADFLAQFKTFNPRAKLEETDLTGFDWDWVAKFGGDVDRELIRAYELALIADFPNAEAGAVQRLAGAWSEKRGAQLLKLDGEQSLVTLTRQRVGQIVADAVVSGDSIGKITKTLREDFAFSRSRATLVARTESGKALGQGMLGSAQMQGRDEKRWTTQGDDLVRPGHVENGGAGWIAISEVFPNGEDTIGEPNCRCVVRYRTAELHDGTALVDAVICPTCTKRLPVNGVPVGAEAYCKRCNKTFSVQAPESAG